MEQVALEAVELSEADAVQFNTEQLLDGETSKRQKLPDYSPVSVFVYNKRPGPWQLKDTGAFHNSFFLNTDKWPVIFDAKDEKKSLIFGKLAEKGYVSEEIFGLNEKNLERFGQMVIQRLRRKVVEILQL